MMAAESAYHVQQAGGADRFRRSLHDTPASTAFTDVPCGVCPVRTLSCSVLCFREIVLPAVSRPHCLRIRKHKAQRSVCDAPLHQADMSIFACHLRITLTD